MDPYKDPASSHLSVAPYVLQPHLIRCADDGVNTPRSRRRFELDMPFPGNLVYLNWIDCYAKRRPLLRTPNAVKNPPPPFE